MSKWVQHISGQGEKWEVFETDIHKDDPYWDSVWTVHRSDKASIILPKSEYKECEPPEEWEDVTADCYVEQVTDDRMRIMCNGLNILRQSQEHRLRKVQHPVGVFPQWAFIVERKKS